SAAFFRPKTLQTSGYVLNALFGFQHVTGEFLLTTGTIVLLFISLFLAVAQERNQFIDRLALQPARIQIPAYVLAFVALELFPAYWFSHSFERKTKCRMSILRFVIRHCSRCAAKTELCVTVVFFELWFLSIPES